MDISVILPIHKWDDKIKVLFEKAIESVKIQDGVDITPEVIVVYASSLLGNEDFSNEIHKDRGLKITFLKNEGKTNFQAQVNLGAKEVKTKWFSILEFDDEYSLNYFKIMNSYLKNSEFKDIEIFLPIIVETTDKDQTLKLTNETIWSRQFVGENGIMGYLNAHGLNQYTDFKICGALIKTEEFNEAGGLKTNIELTFQYEFLLRYLNNASKIYTVPKIGYRHFATREGSLFHALSQKMTMQERKFWFETAKKEANFFTDREIDLTFKKTDEQPV